ncbi:MAG: cytochrome c3 family protein [Desulfuromonadaceae bacterium]|nr:cytochrome c3 family protein [Desulfuromonadaceae bacterium]MDD5106952.1 cytochrome c3 family protein [Desulfuromonadaceae bacterium]
MLSVSAGNVMLSNRKFRYIFLLVACTLLLLPGCDPLTRYKVTSTIFDGVPDLPPPAQFCEEYAEKKIAEAQATLAEKDAAKNKLSGSTHFPYEEKRCNDCHDKNKEGGLVQPKNKLCFVCHTDFIQGEFVHGPIATADCLACHEPHSSLNPKLLKTAPEKVCALCHTNKRAATAMHDKFAARKLLCVDCHDPHFGNAQFFLR